MQEAERRRLSLELTPFFGGLEAAAFDRILAMLAPRVHGAGAVVFREGDPGRSLYVVGEGRLMKWQSGDSGRQVKHMRLEAGDFFGEMELIEIQPRQFTVVSETPSLLYELTNRDLYRLYQEDVHAYVMVLQNINRELCRNIRKAHDRITEHAEQLGEEVTQIVAGIGHVRRQVIDDKK
ncbi:MAG TPA: cyclic nucleotide-binding domain-containing protein [Byssovorax sp.]|jgi:CRP-like cAMP-binding protein